MNEKEKNIYETIKRVVDNKIPKKDAASILRITPRHINRLIQKYHNEGEKGFIHKSKGKSSQKKIDSSIVNQIVDNYQSEYYDYNFTHYHEEIKDKYGISYFSLYNILNNEDIISPMAQKNTKNAYMKKMEEELESNTIKEETKVIYETRLIQEEKSHIRRSSNIYKFGEDVQMDATFAIWFGDTKVALHLAVDKGTKKVLSSFFDYEETTRAYFTLLHNIIVKYGIPQKIKTDNRSTFSINRKTELLSLKKTRFGDICKELEINLYTCSEATFKPNVERENGTFKGRLIAELRHENITDIDAANKYLNEVFIPKINMRFSYDIDVDKSVMRPNTYNKQELNLLFSERKERKIDNACCIKLNSKYYTPVDNYGNVVRYKRQTLCIVILAYDYTLWCQIEGNYYKLKEVQTTSKEDHRIYIPDDTNPWKHFKI